MHFGDQWSVVNRRVDDDGGVEEADADQAGDGADVDEHEEHQNRQCCQKYFGINRKIVESKPPDLVHVLKTIFFSDNSDKDNRDIYNKNNFEKFLLKNDVEKWQFLKNYLVHFWVDSAKSGNTDEIWRRMSNSEWSERIFSDISQRNCCTVTKTSVEIIIHSSNSL